MTLIANTLRENGTPIGTYKNALTKFIYNIKIEIVQLNCAICDDIEQRIQRMFTNRTDFGVDQFEM